MNHRKVDFDHQYGKLERDIPSPQILEMTNRYRRSQDLLPIEVKTRECLKCTKEFKGVGYANRLCPRCKDAGKHYATWGA